MGKYLDVVNDLETTLNFKSTNEDKAKLNKQVFSNALNVLRDEFKTSVSTKFLRGFVVGNDKQKSNRVAYMLKAVGLTERKRITDCFLEKSPTLISKEVDVLLYSSKIDKDDKERICLKVVGMTSHDENGIKRPCKVGIYSRKLRTTTLHNVTL